MKGTDERDGLFARLFGLIALVQSGCLFSSQKGKAAKEATEVVGNVLACLVELGGKKGWLRESAWWGVGQALEGAISMPEGEGRKAILEKLYDVIREEKVFTQEKLALVLTLEKAGLVSSSVLYPLTAAYNLDLSGKIPCGPNIQAQSCTFQSESRLPRESAQGGLSSSFHEVS